MHTMHYALCHGNRQCDKKFNVTHKLVHTREIPHSCNSCEKAFSQINSLKCHILSHTGENAPSVENLSLKMVAFKNIKRFTREKSQTSNQCDYACSDPSSLRKHMKTHNGIKSNKCSQCDFASSHAGNLRTHLKTHSGEKSNKCSQCDFASSRAHTLREL